MEPVVLKPQDNTAPAEKKKILLVTGGIIVLLLLLVGLLVTWEKTKNPLPVGQQPSPTTPATNPLGITEQKPVDERERIAQWFARNQLNQYGDPMGTIYPNGSLSPFGNKPPTNPKESGDLWYTYIIARYPDKPWNK